jgi:hypothetical protein
MKEVVYRGLVLAKGSRALELWQEWQKEKKDRNAAQKKLDAHMRDVEQRHEALMRWTPPNRE